MSYNEKTSTENFVERLNMVEEEMRHHSEMRHEQNSKMVHIIDQMRLDQQDADERLRSLSRSVEKLVLALEGSMGISGMVELQRKQTEDIEQLKAWKARASAFYAGMAAVLVILGSVIEWVIKILSK